MRTILSVLFAFSTVFASGKLYADGNLVQNGSFEINNGYVDWTLSSGTLMTGTCLQYEDGYNGVALGPNGVLYQDIPTVPGLLYDFSFYLAEWGPSGVPANVVSLTPSLGSTAFDPVNFDGTGKTFQCMGWQKFEYLVFASNATTRVAFYNASTNAAEYGWPMIDNVSVTSMISVPPSKPGLALALKSVSGKLTTTAFFGTNSSTTANQYTTMSFNTKSLMCLITNTVKSIAPAVNVPKDVCLAVDPYTSNVFLTNSQGFYLSLSDSSLASFSINTIATKFRTGFHGAISETDIVNARLKFSSLHDPGFNYYEIEIQGDGVLTINRNSNGAATMTLSINGGGFGENQNQTGVCAGAFTLRGCAIPPKNGLPYSVYWWNNLRDF